MSVSGVPLAFQRSTRQSRVVKCRTMIPAIAALLLATSASAQQRAGDLHSLPKDASGQIEFGIITNKGYVSFAVGGEWALLDVKTEPPITTMLFRIPNSADEGSPDSTSCTVMSFENGVPEAMAGLERMVSKAAAEGKKANYGKWTTFKSSGLQEKTTYQVRAAVREFQGTTVFVYSAWPQLPKNSKNYDELMDAVFRALLDTVKGGLGPKPMREGETIRRPPGGTKDAT